MIDTQLIFKEMKSSRQADGSIRAHWQVPADLPYFDGHFPGSPIFPAVGIVDASLQALRVQMKKPSLHLAGVPMAKFLVPITPQQKIIVDLQPLSDTDWQAEWKSEDSLKLLASLRLRLVV